MKKRPDLSASYFFKTWTRQSWDLIGAMLPIHSLFFLLVVAAFAPAGGILAFSQDKDLPFLPWGGLFIASMALGGWASCLGWLAFHSGMRELLAGGDPSWSDFLSHLRENLKRSVQMFLFLSVGSGVLIFNLFVYPTMLADHPILKTLAMAITAWMLLFLGMVQVHLEPFLALQKPPFRTALWRAVTVTFAMPVRTLGLLAIEFAAAVLFFPPLCFILPGMSATANTLHLMILLEDWKDPYEATSEASPNLP